LTDILGELDYPKEGTLISTKDPDISGWALSKSSHEIKIEISVDGKVIRKANTGLARLDIDKKFQHIKNAFESGFYSWVNLVAFSDGNHTMSVIAKTTDSEKLIAKINFDLKKKTEVIRNTVQDTFSRSDIVDGFKKSGNRFCQKNLVQLGGLKSNDKVLDVGCSIGRVAMPLIKYLNQEGSYEGFDIVPEAISWCKKNITPKYSNFRFTLADVTNKRYNVNAKNKSTEYQFPYSNKTFNFVFLSSVFTHMLPEDLKNYFSEISRVMKTGGKSLITFFLINDESLRLIKQNKNINGIFYEMKGFWTNNKKNPEAAIAYDENFIKNQYKTNGLEIIEPIYYGKWCGREHFTGNQDFIIAKKI